MNYSYNLYSNVPLATDPAKKSSSGGNNMIPVRVVDVILDDTHEEWDKLGRSEAVGAIKYRLLKKDIEDFNFTEGIDNVELTPIVDPNATHFADRYYGSPSWLTVGVNGSYDFNENLSVQARLDNIMDEHYIEFASGVSAAGRNVSVSLVANF